nr:hypothetical protein [Micromonospora sp. DSM 115978]
MAPAHHRDWRKLWRYCRCGLRWRCPDSLPGVPMPFPPPPPERTPNQRRSPWRTSADNRSRRYGHLPHRPLWICRRCAQPWPCGQARLDLLRELGGDPSALRIYLTDRMHEALRDRYVLTPYEMPTPADVWARFLGWTAPPDDQSRQRPT